MKTPKAQSLRGIKFNQFLVTRIYKELQLRASKRGTNVQEFIRVVIIPEYLQNNPNLFSQKRSETMKKGWNTRRANKLHTEQMKDEVTLPKRIEFPQQ